MSIQTGTGGYIMTQLTEMGFQRLQEERQASERKMKQFQEKTRKKLTISSQRVWQSEDRCGLFCLLFF